MKSKRKRLHTEELYDLRSSPNGILVIKSRTRWAGHAARVAKRTDLYRVLVWRPEGKGPLGSPRRRGKDNIKMYLKELRWGGLDWIGLAQDRDRRRAVVKAVMNFLIPLNAGNFLTS